MYSKDLIYMYNNKNVFWTPWYVQKKNVLQSWEIKLRCKRICILSLDIICLEWKYFSNPSLTVLESSLLKLCSPNNSYMLTLKGQLLFYLCTCDIFIMSSALSVPNLLQWKWVFHLRKISQILVVYLAWSILLLC